MFILKTMIERWYVGTHLGCFNAKRSMRHPCLYLLREEWRQTQLDMMITQYFNKVKSTCCKISKLKPESNYRWNKDEKNNHPLFKNLISKLRCCSTRITCLTIEFEILAIIARISLKGDKEALYTNNGRSKRWCTRKDRNQNLRTDDESNKDVNKKKNY